MSRSERADATHGLRRPVGGSPRLATREPICQRFGNRKAQSHLRRSAVRCLQPSGVPIDAPAASAGDRLPLRTPCSLWCSLGGQNGTASDRVVAGQRPFLRVSGGGLEPPRPLRALAPQASASTISPPGQAGAIRSTRGPERGSQDSTERPPPTDAGPAAHWLPTAREAP